MASVVVYTCALSASDARPPRVPYLTSICINYVLIVLTSGPRCDGVMEPRRPRAAIRKIKSPLGRIDHAPAARLGLWISTCDSLQSWPANCELWRQARAHLCITAPLHKHELEGIRSLNGEVLPRSETSVRLHITSKLARQASRVETKALSLSE